MSIPTPDLHSFSQVTPLTCPECGREFHAEVWLIVDGTERPDLLERARAGTLHAVACPGGHTAVLNAPLLLFLPERDPPLLFSPAENTTAVQDQEHARGLLGLFRQRL